MNRRIFLHGLGAALAGAPLAVLAGVPALAQGRQTFSRVVADTRPLEARGGGGAAAVLRPYLQQSLQRVFAGRIGRGPVLTARVQTLQMASFAGSDRFGGVQSDFLEGEAVIGQERIPFLVSLPASTAGSGHLPGSDEWRLRALADAFAGWIARRV